MPNKFMEHPASVGETYGEHFRQAFKFSKDLFFAGFACFVHSVFPWLFTTTASRKVKVLNKTMQRGG
jgi:hypothetical protein